MKKQLLYIFLGITILSAGCIKNTNDSNPVAPPQGKFAGKFFRIHRSLNSFVNDTVKIDVTMEMVNDTFKFTGDTSKHAGSYGKFNYNQSYIEWVDNTVPAGVNSTTLPKPHLNGLYPYLYDGITFKFGASSVPDTLTYYYELKKQAN
jgi:hypothetical protein